MVEILLASGLVMAASLTGILAVWGSVGRVLERNLHFLISFSAGVFVIFAWGLAQEAIEHAGAAAAIGWMLAGALGIWIAIKLMPGLHQHEHGEAHDHRPGHLDPRRMIVTDGIHNAADGIFLAAAFSVGGVFGWTAAFSIFVHEMLQEISEFFVLRDGGYSTRGALAVNLATSGTILVGATGGYFLLETFEVLEAPLLAIAAGGVMVVVLHDLIPHSMREASAPLHYLRHLALFALGAVLMLGVGQLMPHEEAGGHRDEHLAIALDE